MQITHRSQQPSLSSSLTPAAANTVAPQKPVAAQARTQGSGFEAKSSFATSGNKPLVSLTAQTAAPASATPGPLELSSPEARGAIQKSLDFIQKQSGGSSRGFVPGGDAQSAFSPRSVTRDELGMTHVRLDRTHEGVKVFGEQVISHLDKDGKVSGLTGGTEPIPAGLGSGPAKLSSQDALSIAQKAFAGNTDAAHPPSAERVIVQGKDGQYHAAYHVQMTHVNDLKADERPRRMNYFVDANSGEMVRSFDQMGGIELPKDHAGAAQSQTAGTTTPATPATPTTPGTPATGKADDSTLYSGKVDLSTTKQANGTYTLEDKTRGNGVVTYDAKNKATASGQTPLTDKNDVWGEATDDSRTKAAVDAHYGAEMTYDFLKDVLGRNSLDGKGEKLVSYVHVDKNYVNAYWDGEKMNYGDGDGKDAGPLTTLDIAGHEIAHGLTERTAGLIYEGESGGLNEAFSDIMGTGVEWYASQKNSAVEFDWKMGEDAWTPANGTGDALRYMDDPTKDGYSIDNYKNYPKQTEVHGSSGIANNAFYLLANGGKNRTSGQEVKDGIGMEKGLKVFYRALENYMTPNTTFAQARQATINAATDLYGANSVEVQKVKDSWSAVGVK
ncbi:M4 family metallopeptidase [Hyalangium minutum]|uniref:Neutral metalloproteinase n=1 Tax=Hyalangium minutum TaxID=394096 RepID=A0A085W9A2_9BACT|nr:M4 family metallopeptidase [Hyalangium minutum]KFE64265.1 Vibriolysin, extracellular zinc protease [Hyalangium minutum]